MEYTKGPWMVKRLLVTNEDGSIEIADTWNLIGDCPSKSEAEANTKLIAASPDMYEALQKCKQLFDSELMPTEKQCEEYSKMCGEMLQKATL